ncbi:hypothetical protein HPP92_005519 [Vanilla planifolia]|uniref:COP1-interacting protein 7 n=1 Tax=Vanilla planifolia TaxID=51239 RepID=A0A835RLI8_VANPL|nr:hypothetical protein HPP92_005519 [Vanilla planifolia]
MNSNFPLDHALFQLSPRRTRCELFVSACGKTEKLASGFVKPFVTHLRIAEEQVSRAVPSIKLEVGRSKNAATWFNKGTVERFVRFVSTPEVLEIVNTLDAEMLQLEGAKKIYSRGAGDSLSGGNESKAAAAADITKKELVRAIDVRLVAVKQDLVTACARAAAAGFDLASVSELLLFADQFGAFRLSEACKKFVCVCQQRPDLISHHNSLTSQDQQWKSSNDANVRSSSSSDMSIDGPEFDQRGPAKSANSELDNAQLHSRSSQQLPYKAESEALAGSIQQWKHDSQSLLKKDVDKLEDSDPSAASSVEPALQPGGGSRRLSVQDRINLFESKRKEQTISANNSFGSSNGTVVSRMVGARGEHRRNASDMSVERSVLKRWSGTSDMSLDLSSNSSNDHKDSCNTAGTPTSSVDPLTSSSRNTQKKDIGSTESSSSSLMSSKSSLPAISSSYSSTDKDRTFPNGNARNKDAVDGEANTSTSVGLLGLTMEEQTCTSTHMSGSLDCSSHGSLVNQVLSQDQMKDFCNSGEATGLIEPKVSQTNFRLIPDKLVKNQVVSQTSSSVAPDVSALNELDQPRILGQPAELIDSNDIAAQTQVTSFTKLKPFTNKKTFTGAKSNYTSNTEIQAKASVAKVDDMSAKVATVCSQTNDRAFYGNQKESARETHAASLMPSKISSAVSGQGSAFQELKFPVKVCGNDQTKKFRDERVTTETSKASIHRSRNFKPSLEVASSVDNESHASWSNKSNHEVNGVLQMKADELEKLFAEHRLRIDGDQIATTRRSKILDGHTAKSMEKTNQQSPTRQTPEQSLTKYNSSKEDEFDFNSLSGVVENFDVSYASMHMSGDRTPSDDSRGRLYGKYMQKREAKLREEYGPKRAQNEAKMKAMHDSLELSQAEMKAKSSGSGSGRNFTNHRVRAEKIRSFNDRLALKNVDQMTKTLTSDGFDDEHELSESSTGNQSKKFISNKTVSSRTSVSPTPKHSLKSANSGSLKRRTQPENAVAQSVPNFSEFKNENVKPSMVVNKSNMRGQPKSFVRSKSSNEDADTMKEEKSSRFPSTRKSSASPIELNSLPSLNSDETLNKDQISNELDQCLKKENGIPRGSVSVVEKLVPLKTQVELLNNEKSKDVVNLQEISHDMVNDEGFEKESIQENNLGVDPPIDSDIENPRRGLESGDLESENGDVMRLLSQQHEPRVIFPKFNSAGNAQDSPDESSGSWNSRMQHLLAYTQEASDFDASMDSPTDSPASWNSHSLNQMMDSESARMRKKWGNAQVPVIAASSSSRRDVTKGFKRLLKFGRKSRGAEYLTSDWVSVSTASEGDDDQEDGRDLVARPLDDIRKSRMSSAIATYNGLNDGDAFSEQAQSLHNSIPNLPANLRLRDDPSLGSLKAPRSFFSLSSFRSKAAESKLR